MKRTMDGIGTDHGMPFVRTAFLGVEDFLESSGIAGHDCVADICWADGSSSRLEDFEDAKGVALHVWRGHSWITVG